MRDLIEYKCIRHRHLRHQTRNVCCLNLRNIEINLRDSTRFDDCWRCKFIVDSIWDQCILNFRVFSFELILTVYFSSFIACLMSTYSLLLISHRFALRFISTQYAHFNDMNSTQHVFLWLTHWSHDCFAILFSARILSAVAAWAAFSINFFEAKIFVMRFKSCTDSDVAADVFLFDDCHSLVRVNWLILRSYHLRSMLDFTCWK
jgi:hypothetical protein